MSVASQRRRDEKRRRERASGILPPQPPPGCDQGTMINQNLPATICNIGHRVDSGLPPGTLEVWQDGKRIGRIENIGMR